MGGAAPTNGEQVPGATGLADHNSSLTADVRYRVRADNAGFGFGLNAQTGRTYRMVAGIPSVVIDHQVNPILRADISADARLGTDRDMWMWTRFQGNPSPQIESPNPAAAQLGRAIFVGVDYRPE